MSKLHRSDTKVPKQQTMIYRPVPLQDSTTHAASDDGSLPAHSSAMSLEASSRHQVSTPLETATASANIAATAATTESNRGSNLRRRVDRRSWSERWNDKLWAAGFVLLAYLVAWKTQFWQTVLLLNYHHLEPEHSNESFSSSPTSFSPSPLSVKVSRNAPNVTLLQFAAMGMGIQTVLFLYLTFYLPIFKRLHDSSAWDVYCPRVIPTITIVGILTFLIAIRAIWPVYGFFAPIILIIQMFGILFGGHFVPWPF
jgi:hypothetical protein